MLRRRALVACILLGSALVLTGVSAGTSPAGRPDDAAAASTLTVPALAANQMTLPEPPATEQRDVPRWSVKSLLVLALLVAGLLLGSGARVERVERTRRGSLRNGRSQPSRPRAPPRLARR